MMMYAGHTLNKHFDFKEISAEMGKVFINHLWIIELSSSHLRREANELADVYQRHYRNII